jgi:PsbP
MIYVNTRTTWKISAIAAFVWSALVDLQRAPITHAWVTIQSPQRHESTPFIKYDEEAYTNDRLTTTMDSFDMFSNSGTYSLSSQQRRRDFLNRFVNSVTVASTLSLSCKPVFAIKGEGMTIFRRETEQFRYEFQPPPGFVGPGQKPLKTHLDEVNFQSADISGYLIGITVDPVRISSLTEFGTAEEVAARVVLAEVSRDGVFDVKLLEDPISGVVSIDSGSTTTYYQLNYLSSGKRGEKRYIAKFYIQNQKLLAFTAQCKEESYPIVQQGMLEAVQSFRIV